VKIAFDIDGTITKHPQRMAALMAQFPGWVVLTGGIATPDQIDGHKLARQSQLIPFIGEAIDLTLINICLGPSVAEVARLKGEYCRDHQIDILIDDSVEYCRAVQAISPTTTILQVW